MISKKILQLGVYGLAVLLCLVAALMPTQAGILIAIILLVLTVAASIIFPVIYLVQHPSTGKRMLIGLGGLIAIFLVCFLVAAGGEVLGTKDGVLQVLAGAQLSRWVEAGVITLLVMLALSVVIFAAAEIWNTTR